MIPPELRQGKPQCAQADGGFNDIWHKMAPAFKASFQGEGHEVADLRRLLELYQRWQMRFYPHCDFDSFVTKLEKAGRSKVVKAKMGSMRQNLLGLIFPTDEQEQVAAAGPEGDAAGRDLNGGVVAPMQVPPAGGGAQIIAAAAIGASAAAAGPVLGGADEDEDDELVALQREAEWEAAYEAMDELETAPPPRPQQQELHNAGRSPALRLASAAGGAVDDVDMEEELAQLAEEEAVTDQLPQSGQQQVQAPGANGGSKAGELATGDVPIGGNGGEVDRDLDKDEELIALAMGYRVASIAAAAVGPRSTTVAAASQQHRSSSADIVLGPDQHAVGGAAADAAVYVDVSNMHGDGGAATAAEVQEAVMEDEDEELRLLAAMDTSEAEAVVAMRRGAVCASAATALPAQGEVSAAGLASCSGPYEQGVQQYTGTEEFDAELLALAAADTQATLGIDFSNGSGNISLSAGAPPSPVTYAMGR
ncbi:hypothetical protein Vretimale_3491 [Volvox reticuliferus]|uniref:Chromosome segregation in meiosis protein 3 domain-containing protein n=1 Tax=Volvox reticuliferus TaxID=1737510 RepID=A0A8J4BXQ9_9CHLO|nr:hypothetical protein Vretifemale_1045 [Volvox reticuliferus]GIL97924.1 hypothetical protein Vretimale_3491 [Volvox reticuliferus]